MQRTNTDHRTIQVFRPQLLIELVHAGLRRRFLVHSCQQLSVQDFGALLFFSEPVLKNINLATFLELRNSLLNASQLSGKLVNCFA